MKKTIAFIMCVVFGQVAYAQQQNNYVTSTAQSSQMVPVPTPQVQPPMFGQGPVNYDVKPPLPYHTWTDGYRESWTRTETHDIRPLHAWETNSQAHQVVNNNHIPTVTVYPSVPSQQTWYTPQQQTPVYYYPQQQSQWVWYSQYGAYYNTQTGQWHRPQQSGCEQIRSIMPWNW